MGEFFVEKDSSLVLAEMSSLRASSFALMTNSAMSTYDLNGEAVVYSDARYVIDIEIFQLLTERIFLHPIDLFYVWSFYASGIYEISKKKHFVWLWGGGIGGKNRQNDLITIKPIIYAHDFHISSSNVIIAPDWYTSPKK